MEKVFKTNYTFQEQNFEYSFKFPITKYDVFFAIMGLKPSKYFRIIVHTDVRVLYYCEH